MNNVGIGDKIVIRMERAVARSGGIAADEAIVKVMALHDLNMVIRLGNGQRLKIPQSRYLRKWEPSEREKAR